MTTIYAGTGEVVDILDTREAKRLCSAIDKQNKRVDAESGKLIELIADALHGKAWVALKLGSWAELV